MIEIIRNNATRKICQLCNCKKDFSFGRNFVRGFKKKPEEQPKTDLPLAKEQKHSTKPKLQNDNTGKADGTANQFGSPLVTIIKYGAYSGALTALVFGEGAIQQYINNAKNRLQHQESFQKLQQRIDKNISFRQSLNEIWNHLPRLERFALGIIGCNFVILVAWRMLPSRIMARWFTLSALKSQSAYLPMILSNFSHSSFLHFGINMYVFTSFAQGWKHLPAEAECLAPERFLSFYVMAGVAGCYLSLIVKTLSKNIIPSLGASGAILGLVGYFCAKAPDSKLSIVFLPHWTFSAGSALKFIIGFDTLGILLGIVTKWRYYVLDHAGHLGGMCFGLWYAKHGEKILNEYSNDVIEKYQKNRKE